MNAEIPGFIPAQHLNVSKDKKENCVFSSKPKKLNEKHVFAVPIVSFDILEHSYPKCKYYSSYREQSKCDRCWAIGAVEYSVSV